MIANIITFNQNSCNVLNPNMSETIIFVVLATISKRAKSIKSGDHHLAFKRSNHLALAPPPP